MREENRRGTYQFVAEPFHVDFNGRLTMGVLGNHLLNKIRRGREGDRVTQALHQSLKHI